MKVYVLYGYYNSMTWDGGKILAVCTNIPTDEQIEELKQKLEYNFIDAFEMELIENG